MKTIRWGIIGTGGIAHRFANAVKNVPGAELTSVASRHMETANRFGDEFGIPNRFGSYEEMAESDLIDIAYIAVPHGVHRDCAELCMRNKKAVLSEKPITVNQAELQKMIDCARENDVFLMEAMWARLTPGTIKVIDIVRSGKIGKVKGIQGTFCYDMSDEPDHHAFKPEYGGGSLLDVGCYGLHFASWFADSPVETVTALADIGKENHVDEHCCILMKYESGAIASISSGMMVRKPNEGYIFGEKGYIYVKHFYAPEEIELYLDGEAPETIHAPYLGNGFEEQIIECGACLHAGKKESDIVPLSQSMKIMKQMDEIRHMIGVVYPQDVRA